MIGPVGEHDEGEIWTPEVLENPHAAPDKAARVKATFGRIARRYDRVNRILAVGRDRAWRRAAAVAVGPCEGADVLDVACGTGALAGQFVAMGAGRVVGVDFAPEMLAVAREKYAGSAIDWVEADALNLPLDDRTFDVVSIGFGLRNLASAADGLAEMYRVLRPGGRIVVLEFAPPAGPMVGAVVRWIILRVIPLVGRMLSGDRSGGYKYLSASVDTYMTFERLARLMSEAGFVDVRQARRLAAGTVGVHTGVRP